VDEESSSEEEVETHEEQIREILKGISKLLSIGRGELPLIEYQDIMRRLKLAGVASAIMSEMMMTVEGGDHAESLTVRDRSKMNDWWPELQKF
jgi:hypothetical protein